MNSIVRATKADLRHTSQIAASCRRGAGGRRKTVLESTHAAQEIGCLTTCDWYALSGSGVANLRRRLSNSDLTNQVAGMRSAKPALRRMRFSGPDNGQL